MATAPMNRSKCHGLVLRLSKSGDKTVISVPYKCTCLPDLIIDLTMDVVHEGDTVLLYCLEASGHVYCEPRR